MLALSLGLSAPAVGGRPAFQMVITPTTLLTPTTRVKGA
jgi:hypothetical protein